MQDFIEAEQKRFGELPHGQPMSDRGDYIGFQGAERWLKEHDQRLIDKIVEMVEGKKVSYLKSEEGTSHAHHGRGYNQAINDILTTLKGK